MTSGIDLGRPASGDVIDLISDDHRRFERLLAQLRLGTADRNAVRRAFADVLVAHGTAEEEVVYPALRGSTTDIGDHDVDNGVEEHAESNEALLVVLEIAGTESTGFADAVEDLSNVVAHHIAEEELHLLEPARTEISTRVRWDLGARWARRRNELVDQRCGAVESVRQVVARAQQRGLLQDA
ncbi:hemerythrin domain-containing protein [Nocardioides albidus]|uniref:Hemerythrin domain-containing protein n=1 Tax=Nocardioides albidus TaxID=1517589 RepID=A0A5C4WCY5_9ACTN|nr:hemerythrin domain-containing protein [Nocardioides albidus]TNM46088.1 hemerythrin domain-containing protein [Nocardioides albidus]